MEQELLYHMQMLIVKVIIIRKVGLDASLPQPFFADNFFIGWLLLLFCYYFLFSIIFHTLFLVPFRKKNMFLHRSVFLVVRHFSVLCLTIDIKVFVLCPFPKPLWDPSSFIYCSSIIIVILDSSFDGIRSICQFLVFFSPYYIV